MNSDRELLELAAKAAGYPFSDGYYENGWWVYVDSNGEPPNDSAWVELWNPLTDDGDALRLAVKLNMNTYSCDLYSIAEVVSDGLKYAVTKKEYCDSETKLAATRRAIVRAAAEIGRMK